MPSGRYKSRTFRRVFVRTPGSRTIVHYRRRKPSPAVCAHCQIVLAGVPRGTPSQVKKFPKTARRPERPYGGKLCSSCTKALLKQKARESP